MTSLLVFDLFLEIFESLRNPSVDPVQLPCSSVYDPRWPQDHRKEGFAHEKGVLHIAPCQYAGHDVFVTNIPHPPLFASEWGCCLGILINNGRTDEDEVNLRKRFACNEIPRYCNLISCIYVEAVWNDRNTRSDRNQFACTATEQALAISPASVEKLQLLTEFYGKIHEVVKNLAGSA